LSPETAAILAQMQEQNQHIAQMQEQLAQKQQTEQQPELTEEEQAIEELKERLGFNKQSEVIQQLEEKLKQQNELLEMQKQEAYQSAVRSDIDSLRAELKGFDENLVAQELEALSRQPVMLPNGQIARDEYGNPINQAMLMDNKEGWAKIWNDKFAQQEAPKPDPIVPSTAGNTTTSQKSPLDVIRESEDNVETGEALLRLISGD
jgi:exonuclease VII large subunit